MIIEVGDPSFKVISKRFNFVNFYLFDFAIHAPAMPAFVIGRGLLFVELVIR